MATFGDHIRECRANGHEARIYAGQPGRWIASGLDGSLYDFPGVDGGWSQRKPCEFEPHASKLVPLSYAYGTGWWGVDAAAYAAERGTASQGLRDESC